MKTSDLKNKLELSDDAVVLTGSIRLRQKKSDAGTISSLTPHYAMKGCPVAIYDESGEITNPLPQGLSIEATFSGDSAPNLGRVTGSYEKPFQYIHLMLGRDGTAPNNAEAKALREAGALIARMADQPAYLVALPYFTTGQYGVALGRYIPLALFSRAPGKEPEAIWVHPEAEKVGLLKCALPRHQLIRSLDAEPINQASPSWYAELMSVMGQATKLTGLQLHNHVIGTYANQLILQKRASSMSEANKLARDEYEQYKKALKDEAAVAPKEGKAETNTNPEPLPSAPAPRLSKAGATGSRRA